MSEALSSSVVSTFLWSPLLLSTLTCWQNQGRVLQWGGRGRQRCPSSCQGEAHCGRSQASRQQGPPVCVCMQCSGP